MKAKLAAITLTSGLAVAMVAAPASAHPLNPPGAGKTISIGGPLGSPTPGDGAQGHWRGIDCNAADGKTPIMKLDICVK